MATEVTDSLLSAIYRNSDKTLSILLKDFLALKELGRHKELIIYSTSTY
jgi:hypothetical protein